MWKLTWLAKKVLAKYNPRIIAVTGSVGKTGTKDAIFAAIAPRFNVRKSEKSFNSEIGIPLTILGCGNAWANPILWIDNFLHGLHLLLVRADYPDWLVLEVGADRPGDIQSVSEWLAPDIVVITRIPKVPVHVEYFSSPFDVSREKMFLAKALKQDGVLILNADDEDVMLLGAEIERKKVTYGVFKDADVEAGDILVRSEVINKADLPTGITFEIRTGGGRADVSVNGVVGAQTPLSAAAAAAVGIEMGLSLGEVADNLKGLETPTGRMRIIRGVKDTTIIDDTYNSSPSAVEAALEALNAITVSGRKIAVLGDMLELGRFSIDEHKRIGAEVAKIADILVTIGVRARGMAEGALQSRRAGKKIFQYEDPRAAGREIEQMLKAGDIILVKGSQGARTEKFVEEIMAEPERKGELLVRQSKEWVYR